MFLNTFRRMFNKLFGYMFRNRKRISHQFTDEEFATVAQACSYSSEEGSSNDDCDYDFDPPPDCPANLPKGYVSISDGFSTYAILLACLNCGKHGDHLSEDCKIKSCDSEYFKSRFPDIPPPKESPYEKKKRGF